MKIYYMRQHNILPAEYPYSACRIELQHLKAQVYINKDLIQVMAKHSAGRIFRFCQQNLNILLAEFGYSAERIKSTKKQLHGAEKASAPKAELGLAQPQPVYYIFISSCSKLSQPNNNHNPNNKTTKIVVGMRLSNRRLLIAGNHHHPLTTTQTQNYMIEQ